MRAAAAPGPAWIVVLLAATALAGCTAGPPTGSSVGSTVGSVTTTSAHPSDPDDAPTPPSPSSTGSGTQAGRACPDRPVARGSADNLVVVAVSGPSTAASGSTVTVSSQLVVLSSGPRIVLTAQGSSMEVLRGSTVVGRTPAAAGPDIPLPLTTGTSYPGQLLPTRVALVGCDGSPLPPGAYGLRAVVAYGGDPLGSAPGGTGGAGRFVLVSDPPTDLTIT